MPGALNNFIGTAKHFIGVPPDDVPKTMTLLYTFPGANVKQTFDFIEQGSMGLIDTIQSVYIDNDTPAKITLQVEGGPMYRIIAKARSQGWYPLALPAGMQLSFQADQANAGAVQFVFANVAICAGPWATA